VRDSNDAVTVQGLDGRILAWNRSARRMYGWSEDEALALSATDRVPEDRRAECASIPRRLQADEVLDPLRTQRLTRDGRVLDVWLTLTKLVDENGAMTAMATTERDISWKVS
jgi:two-component system, chemotaxis family, CheB/CheR fusion protein